MNEMTTAGIRAFAKSVSPAFFFKATGIVLFLFFIVSEAFTLPEVLSAILGIFWLLYVPFGIGNLFIMIPIKSIKGLSNYLQSIKIANILIEWFIGLFLVLLLTFAINQLSMASILGPILLFAAAVSFHLKSPSSKIESKFFLNRSIVIILIIGSILGFSFGAYIRSLSPYPLTVGFDLFAHMHVAKSVLNGPIDTNTVVYLPTFDILIGLGSTTFKADVIGLFWIGPILLFSLFGIALYAMSYWITKNHICAFIGSFIGLSVTEMGLVPNLPHFYPASFVMCIFPLTFVIVDIIWKKPSKDKKLPIILTVIIFSGLIVIHYDLGLVASSILLLYLIILYYTSKKDLVLLILRLITICVGIITLMYFWGYIHFQIQIQHIFNQSHLIDNTYLYDMRTKLMYLSQFYSTKVLSFSILGLVALSLFTEKRAVIMGFIALVLLVVDFQQIAIIDRILSLERPLLSFAAAVLLMMPSLIIFKRFRSAYPIHVDSDSKILSTHKNLGESISDKLRIITLSSQITRLNLVYGIAITILLLPTLVIPYKTYLEPFYQHGDTFSNFDSQELAAAKWIEKNTPKNYLVFSDPFTAFEMRGLAFRQNIDAIGWNLTIAKLVKSVMTSENASEAYNKIVSNNGKNLMIIVTPRTSQWLKVNDLNSAANRTNYFLDFPIEKFVSFRGFNKFFNTEYFNLEYHSNNIFVFTLNTRHTLSRLY